MLAPDKPPVHVMVPVHPVNVKVVSEPVHIVGLLAEAVKFNTTVGLTVIVISFDLGLGQVPDVQTAEYVVVEFTVSVIVAPVLLFDHNIVPDVHPVAVNVTEPPAQTLSGTDVIVGVCGAPTFTVTGSDVFASPHPSTVHFTE